MTVYAVRIFDSEADLRQGNKSHSQRITTSTGGKDLTNVLAGQNDKWRRVGVYKVQRLWGFLPFQVESQATLSLAELRAILGMPEFAGAA